MSCCPLLMPPSVRKTMPLLHSSGPHNARFDMQTERKPASQLFSVSICSAWRHAGNWGRRDRCEACKRVQRICRGHAKFKQGSGRGHAGLMKGSGKGYGGVRLRSCRGHAGLMEGSGRGHAWLMQGIQRDQHRN